MGLASALSTALTGLNAAEATIDVTGNNVANSNTVGFKSSNVQFATQFSQTQSLGSSPSGSQGGTNPLQVGLGAKVAQITPDFTQGTLQVSGSASDLAIQGDGFFIVDGGQGTQLYTRNGVFKTNANNELVSITGQRLLGLGVNDSFQVENTSLKPITIPFGASAVAEATQTVVLGGTMRANGEIGTVPSIIQSQILTDGSIEVPQSTATTSPLDPPVVSAATSAASAAAGAIPAGQYAYRVAFVNAAGQEGSSSLAFGLVTTTGTAGVDQSITLSNLPGIPSGFTGINVYRADNGGTGTFALVGNTATNTFTDTAAAGTTTLVDTTPGAGSYSYYVTFFDSLNNVETRPTSLIGPQAASASERISLNNLPIPQGANFNQIKIYRNTAGDPGTFRLLTTSPLPAGTTSYIDSTPDAAIVNNARVNLDGPAITTKTLLSDVVTRSGSNYVHVFNPNFNPSVSNNGFQAGSLDFSGQKGNASVGKRTLAFDGATTVQDLIAFVQQSTGIQDSSSDPLNPVPGTPGGTVANSRLQFTSNMGAENAVSIGVDGFQMTLNGLKSTVNLGFNQTQQANGESAKVDLVVFNALGEKLNLRVTTVLQEKTGTGATWRWFADSANNSPLSGYGIALGTGEFTFDSTGHISSVTNNSVSIAQSGGTNSLPFEIDFSQLSGLAAEKSTLFVQQRDGSEPGTLTSFVVGEDGLISGVYSNGVSRTLGQIRLVRFANNAGLEQRGQNLFALGVNSGVPIEANPGDLGVGTLKAGFVEQSNTDVGQNLIDLIIASTQYRGGARVITTVQQLLDELLNLRR